MSGRKHSLCWSILNRIEFFCISANLVQNDMVADAVLCGGKMVFKDLNLMRGN